MPHPAAKADLNLVLPVAANTSESDRLWAEQKEVEVPGMGGRCTQEGRKAPSPGRKSSGAKALS